VAGPAGGNEDVYRCFGRAVLRWKKREKSLAAENTRLVRRVEKSFEGPPQNIPWHPETGFTGHLSIECEGQGGPMLTQSLQWLRQTLAELGIPEEKA